MIPPCWLRVFASNHPRCWDAQPESQEKPESMMKLRSAGDSSCHGISGWFLSQVTQVTRPGLDWVWWVKLNIIHPKLCKTSWVGFEWRFIPTTKTFRYEIVEIETSPIFGTHPSQQGDVFKLHKRQPSKHELPFDLDVLRWHWNECIPINNSTSLGYWMSLADI